MSITSTVRLLLGVFLIWGIWKFAKDKIPSSEAEPTIGFSIYHQNELCGEQPPTPEAIQAAAETMAAASRNNPLNIKFTSLIKSFGGEDSGVPTKDEPRLNWAKFATSEDGIAAGGKLLHAPLYLNKTINDGLLIWSHGSYGGGVVKEFGLDPNVKIGSLNDEQIDRLVAAIKKRESGGSTVLSGTTKVVSKNDHYLDRVDKFWVRLTPGCFDSEAWVRTPQFWRGQYRWGFIPTSEPNRHLGIWFVGSNQSKGPFPPGQLLAFPYPPTDTDGTMKMRFQGVGTLEFICVSCS